MRTAPLFLALCIRSMMENINLISVGVITILFVHHVYTLPTDVLRETRIAKILALVFCSILFVALLINSFVASFFEFHFLMLVAAFIPTLIYSLVYERSSSSDT
jgi:hypothetical protein